MRWSVVIGGAIVVAGLALLFARGQFGMVGEQQPSLAPSNTPMLTATTSLQLTSSAFTDNQPIPLQYTCDGENTNPPLAITGVPESAQSLALIVDDPDAPGGTWTHWTVWNIAPTTTEIAAHAVPDGAVEGTTSFGKPGYGGPCPPSGTHHYVFTLYALDTPLSLSSDADVAQLKAALAGPVMAKTQLIGLYQRQK